MQEKYTRFKNEIWNDKEIKGYEKLVLIYLISYHNKNLDYAYPTRKKIQDETGISENTLGKVLKSLEEKGYISKEIYTSKTGKNNIYYIHKYLVACNDNENSQEQHREPVENNSSNSSSNSSSKDLKSNTEPQRKSQKNKQYNKTNENGYVNNNYPVKTKYHGAFNEHFRKYSEDELESKLLKLQNSKA